MAIGLKVSYPPRDRLNTIVLLRDVNFWWLLLFSMRCPVWDYTCRFRCKRDHTKIEKRLLTTSRPITKFNKAIAIAIA